MGSPGIITIIIIVVNVIFSYKGFTNEQFFEGYKFNVDKIIISKDYKTALISGIGTISSGLIVKFLTKGASYKAVDLFNGIAIKKIKEIFSIAPASNNVGIGLYVKLD